MLPIGEVVLAAAVVVIVVGEGNKETDAVVGCAGNGVIDGVKSLIVEMAEGGLNRLPVEMPSV
jgi:hypothetical protein